MDPTDTLGDLQAWQTRQEPLMGRALTGDMPRLEQVPAEQQEQNTAKWTGFFDRLRSDPRMQRQLFMFFSGLAKPNPYGAWGKLSTGADAMMAERMRQEAYDAAQGSAGQEQALAERELRVKEGGLNREWANLERQSAADRIDALEKGARLRLDIGSENRLREVALWKLKTGERTPDQIVAEFQKMAQEQARKNYGRMNAAGTYLTNPEVVDAEANKALERMMLGIKEESPAAWNVYVRMMGGAGAPKGGAPDEIIRRNGKCYVLTPGGPKMVACPEEGKASTSTEPPPEVDDDDVEAARRG